MRNKLVFLLVGILVVVRFMYLDQDAPAYMIAGVSQDDEPYYSLGAISRYNADNDRLIKGFEHVRGEVLLLQNTYTTYLSMKLFGSNYWSIRLPSVLLSILTILLLYDMLRKLMVNKTWMLLIMLYVFTDFYFFLFSRFQAPQIYSILAVTWVLWLYFKFGTSSRKGLFLLGLFTIFAISFINMFNLFLLMAFGMLILYRCFVQKNLKPLLFFGLGALTCLMAYVLTLASLESAFSDTWLIVTTHGGGMDSPTTADNTFLFSLKSLYSKFIQLPLTNLFRYNLSVLFVFFFAFPYIIQQVVRERNERHLLYFLFVFSLVLQFLFTVHYSFKKLIIVFPIVVLILADVLPNALNYYRQLSQRRKIYLFVYSFIPLVFCFLNFKVNNSEAYWAGLKSGYYENTTSLYSVLNFLALGITLGFIWINLFSQGLRYSRVLLFPAAIGSFLILKYCFIERSFYEKEGLQNARSLLHDKGVVMGVSYVAQFYTDCKPALSCYGDLYHYGDERYLAVGDSLFRSGAAEFTIEKVKKPDLLKPHPNPNLKKVMTIATKYYYLIIYQYTGRS